jgi:hypothetical protein
VPSNPLASHRLLHPLFVSRPAVPASPVSPVDAGQYAQEKSILQHPFNDKLIFV